MDNIWKSEAEAGAKEYNLIGRDFVVTIENSDHSIKTRFEIIDGDKAKVKGKKSKWSFWYIRNYSGTKIPCGLAFMIEIKEQ